MFCVHRRSRICTNLAPNRAVEIAAMNRRATLKSKSTANSELQHQIGTMTNQIQGNDSIRASSGLSSSSEITAIHWPFSSL